MTAALLFNILVGLGIPIAVLVYLLVRRRKLLPSFFFGIATFAVFQMFTRIPLLNLLGGQAWYRAFALANPVLHGILLAFTAGLFEEGGRLIVMKLLMKKRLTTGDGLAFGIGHGGLEAGIVGLNNLLILLFYQNLVIGQSPLMISLAGVERLGAMALHVALSLLVLRAVRERKPAVWLLALALHTAIDSMILLYSLGIVPLLLFEGLFLAATGLILGYAIVTEKRSVNT